MINYPLYSKVLHNLCLNNKFIRTSLYELEKIFFLKNKDQKIINEEHIFITGMPRAGTTAVLNYIYYSGLFSSLLYKDMPFLFSPNFQSLLSFNRKISLSKRVHDDGIMINLDSPEAFDEVFLNNFEKHVLEIEFLNYVQLVIKKHKKRRYISKNNYNYKRINFLKKVFPSSKILVIFRNPLDQSFSLLNQHINFSNLHKTNAFSKKYMKSLYHFEFGDLHSAWSNPNQYFNNLKVNYWLEQWYLFYKKMIDSYYLDNFVFINYDLLEKSDYLSKFKKYLKIEKSNFDLNFNSKPHNEIGLDKKLNFNCKIIYNKMSDLSKKTLNTF
jgi:hypothetical protein